VFRAAEATRAEFASIVGETRVCYDDRACAAWRVDGMTPSCIVYPGSVGQVAEMLKCASEHELAVIPVGGGTKLETGNPPRKYDIALSLRELNKVRYYEPPDLTVGVEAGMTLDDFENLVNRDGLWLPLDPPGGGQGTIGGIVATNASGPMRHFYGAPRDMVLGMRIATTDGKLIKTGGRVVKNVAGYDLGKLLIGSYGTLGIIVEVNFKLYPIPAERRTFVLQAGTLGIARDLRRSILNSPIEPLSMVLLDASTAGLLHPDPSLKSGV
jgi:glycolate dehydrogenase FAD-binding subunit